MRKLALPLIIGSGLGVALLASLAPSAARAAQRAAPSAEPRRKRRGRKAKRKPSRRPSSSKRRRTTAIPAPPKPKAKRARATKPSTKELPTHAVSVAPPGELPTHSVHVAPPAPPKPDASAPSLSPRAAAQRLYDYARAKVRAGKASELGSKAKRNGTIKAYQAAMGKISADGIYGPKTRARGKELLGRAFPARVSKPKRAAPPPETELAPIVVNEEAPELRSPKEAAQELFDYAKSAPKVKGRGAWFGTANAPSSTVEAAQRDMGGLKADGIYGPKTRKRGRALLGRVFPAR